MSRIGKQLIYNFTDDRNQATSTEQFAAVRGETSSINHPTTLMVYVRHIHAVKGQIKRCIMYKGLEDLSGVGVSNATATSLVQTDSVDTQFLLSLG